MPLPLGRIPMYLRRLRAAISFAAVCLLLLALSATACSSGDSRTAQSSKYASLSTAEKRPDLARPYTGPLSSDGLQAILATGDLGVGTNRFSFVLTSSSGIVNAPNIVISSFKAGSQKPIQSTSATYSEWPYGTKGSYATTLQFDQPGNWRVEIQIPTSSGTEGKAELFFDVKGKPDAPNVGASAVKSVSKTIRDVARLSQLATGSLLDADLYQQSISEATRSGSPTVVVMASPAFCTNAVCGPQVEVLRDLKDKYKGKANFIHVDFYDNPEEVQGDLAKARLSSVVLEWNLPSIEWTFVIDKNGVISSRFEGFATLQEVEEALKPLL